MTSSLPRPFPHGAGAQPRLGGDPGAAQLGDGRLEILQGIEGGVDRGEAQVGDLVELAQRTEDRQADVMGVDERLTAGTDGLLDPVGQEREVVIGDGAALTGAPHPTITLSRLKGLNDAGTLADRQGWQSPGW